MSEAGIEPLDSLALILRSVKEPLPHSIVTQIDGAVCSWDMI